MLGRPGVLCGQGAGEGASSPVGMRVGELGQQGRRDALPVEMAPGAARPPTAASVLPQRPPSSVASKGLPGLVGRLVTADADPRDETGGAGGRRSQWLCERSTGRCRTKAADTVVLCNPAARWPRPFLPAWPRAGGGASPSSLVSRAS